MPGKDQPAAVSMTDGADICIAALSRKLDVRCGRLCALGERMQTMVWLGLVLAVVALVVLLLQGSRRGSERGDGSFFESDTGGGDGGSDGGGDGGGD